MLGFPVRFDMNITALLSGVQSNAMSAASSSVSRRGVLALAVFAEDSERIQQPANARELAPNRFPQL